jgi:hypothetical protein
MRKLPCQPLLLSLLAALGSAGCGPDHEKDVSYIAGELQPLGDHQEEMPDLPCLPTSDSRLRAFNPSCENTFEITGGPTQSTNADGKPICVYHIEYDINDNCQIGRPLVRDSFVVVAPLHATSAWV